MQDAEPPESPPPPRKPFQFGLKRLLLIMALLSVVFAILGGMFRSSLETGMPPGFFELMAAAAPIGAMVVISLSLAIREWIRRSRR